MNHSKMLRAIVGDNTEWMDQAACRRLNPDVFHPPKGDTAGIPKAMSICHSCPVTEPCLQRAIELGPGKAQGVWAGTSEIQRHRMRHQRRRTAS